MKKLFKKVLCFALILTVNAPLHFAYGEEETISVTESTPDLSDSEEVLEVSDSTESTVENIPTSNEESTSNN